jgi:hypothetical protein
MSPVPPTPAQLPEVRQMVPDSSGAVMVLLAVGVASSRVVVKPESVVVRVLDEKAYGTAESLKRGVISESVGVQLPHAQEPVPLMVIPRYMFSLQVIAPKASYSPR